MNSPTVLIFNNDDPSTSEFDGRISVKYVQLTFLNDYVEMSYPTTTIFSSGEATIADPIFFHFSLMMEEAWSKAGSLDRYTSDVGRWSLEARIDIKI